jgi:polyphosphate kinase
VPGRIVWKLNAIIDGEVIRALCGASQAGVPVDLLVRGICGLRPGLPGISDAIRVRSVVGRFLEHARIFAFSSGEDTRYFIGSADMMGRNLDARVELLTPVEDLVAQSELKSILDATLADNDLAWALSPDGTWHRVEGPMDAAPRNSQDELMARSAAR